MNHESPQTRALERRLEAERPQPSAEFRSDLGRRVAVRSRRLPTGAEMRRLALICAILGSLLLLVAALGAAGVW